MTLLRKAKPTDNFKEDNLFDYLFLFLFPKNVFGICNLTGFDKKKFALIATCMQKLDTTRILGLAKWTLNLVLYLEKCSILTIETEWLPKYVWFSVSGLNVSANLLFCIHTQWLYA